jgi:hypothetical protein
MVCGVSFPDQEIGLQTRHSVPFETVVCEQLATSNPLARTSVSFDSQPQPFVILTALLLQKFGLALALGQPDDASKDAKGADEISMAPGKLTPGR